MPHVKVMAAIELCILGTADIVTAAADTDFRVDMASFGQRLLQGIQ